MTTRPASITQLPAPLGKGRWRRPKPRTRAKSPTLALPPKARNAAAIARWRPLLDAYAADPALTLAGLAKAHGTRPGALSTAFQRFFGDEYADAKQVRRRIQPQDGYNGP